MKIAGLQKSSLVDYPSKIAAVVFTQGCNFRCGYCHNPDILEISKQNKCFDENFVLDFLKTRQNKLDAVVISGGEPTLQKDLETFILKLRSLNFLVKLDTNGTNPDIIKQLSEKNCLDYIAMDIKAPLNKYKNIVCTNTDTAKIQKSIDFIIHCGIEYEFRTTVVKSQLDFKDFENIGKTLTGAKRYYLQKFVNSTTLDPSFKDCTTYSDTEFEQIKNLLDIYIKNVYIR